MRPDLVVGQVVVCPTCGSPGAYWSAGAPWCEQCWLRTPEGRAEREQLLDERAQQRRRSPTGPPDWPTAYPSPGPVRTPEPAHEQSERVPEGVLREHLEALLDWAGRVSVSAALLEGLYRGRFVVLMSNSDPDTWVWANAAAAHRGRIERLHAETHQGRPGVFSTQTAPRGKQ